MKDKRWILPVVSVVAFMAVSIIYEIEWGWIGYVISGGGLAFLIWYGFLRKGKKVKK